MFIIVLILWVAIGINCAFDWDDTLKDLGKWQRVLGYGILIVAGPIFLFNSLLTYVLEFLGFDFDGDNKKGS